MHRAVAGLVALAALAMVTPAQAQISTFSKSGRDALTGSTANSSGATGQTATGSTINWVLSYRNNAGASAQVDITDPITGNHTYVPGSLRTPPDLEPRWSTNGGTNYTVNEPATGVNAIRATGTSANGSTGAIDEFSPPATAFTATGSGDGFEALFIGDNLYNIFHHRDVGNPVNFIDCHVKNTGARCAGYPAWVSGTAGADFNTGPDNLLTSHTPFAATDRANGRIYFPTQVSGTTNIGVGCIDVVNTESCGFVELDDASAATTVGAHIKISGGTQIGNRFFLMGIGAGAPIYCFDMSTQTACAGYPIQGSPTYTATGVGTAANFEASVSQVEDWDDRYLFANPTRSNGQRDMVCLDTTTNTLCPGFPVVNVGGGTTANVAGAVYNIPIAPLMDPAGAITGVCQEVSPANTTAPFACVDLSGTPVDLNGPAAGDQPWGQMSAGSLNWVSFGAIEVIGTRLYGAYTAGGNAATYACWDFATVSECDGFVEASTGANVRAYTVRQDPLNPDCIWTVGDAGIFEVFSATFGGTTCKEGFAQIGLQPETFYCDQAGSHVTGWDELVIGGVTAADYDGASVTIRDANGVGVPGFVNLVVPNTQQTVDLSSIPYSGSTTELQISVAINWGGHPTGNADLTATFTGDPTQVCYQTVVEPGACATTTDITNVANAVTTAGGTSDAPAGNTTGPARFVQAADPAVCRADLAIVKIAGSDPLIRGTDERYTLRVTNNGPDTATDVRVTDPMPSGLAFMSGSEGCVHDAGVVTCTLASLASGASHDFEVLARATGAASDPTTNTATVTSDVIDPVPTNNTSTVTVALQSVVDLTVAITPSVPVANPGDTVTWTVVPKNNGPSDATGVTTTITLPVGVTYVSDDRGCAASGQVVTCPAGGLAGGADAPIRIVTRVTAQGGPLTLTATATIRGDQPEPNLANNTASASITVPAPRPPSVTPPTPPSTPPRLQLTQSLSRRTLRPGQSTVITERVRNPGRTTLTNVRVCTTIPEGLDYVSSTPRARLSNGRRCWTIARLRPGQSATRRITARAQPGFRGRVRVNASASARGARRDTETDSVNVLGVLSERAGGVTG